eukprot:3797209-Prymnesium_polylepis.2
MWHTSSRRAAAPCTRAAAPSRGSPAAARSTEAQAVVTRLRGSAWEQRSVAGGGVGPGAATEGTSRRVG